MPKSTAKRRAHKAIEKNNSAKSTPEVGAALQPERNRASKINPLIDSECATGTLDNCAAMLRCLGHMVDAATEQPLPGPIFLFAEVMASALEFESEVRHA